MPTEQTDQRSDADTKDADASADSKDAGADSKDAGADAKDTDKNDAGQLTEKPEVTEEHKEKAAEMRKAYDDENLQTTTLPGSDGTVAGTAVGEWVDEEDKGKIETSAEEGKVEYRNTEEFKKIQES